MPVTQSQPSSRRFWQLVSLAGLLCLAYFSWLMLPDGGLLGSTNRLALALILLLFSGISASFAYKQNWRVQFEGTLNRPVWRVCLAFLAFTLAGGTVYLAWLSFITTDQQWYGLLLRLRPLLLWLAFAGILALVWFRHPGANQSKQRANSKPAVMIGLGAITLIGILMRLKFLNYPAHFDEVMSYMRFAADSAWTALSFYPAPNNHVLHSLLVLLNTRLFGDSLPAIRLAAFNAGVLSIPVVFWLARRWYDEFTGLLAAGLVAVSSYHIQYSVNGRGHMLVALAVLLALLLAERTRNDPALGNWLMFTLVSILGFATIPVMLYAYLGILIWLLSAYLLKDVSPDYNGLFPLYLVLSGFSATMLTLLFYSPILLTSGWRALSGNAFVASAGWAPLLGKLPAFLADLWATWVRDLPPGVAILVAIGVVLSLVFHKRQINSMVWLGFPMMLGCALVLFVQRAIPFTRVWLFLLPLAMLLAAAGWTTLWRRIWSKSDDAKAWLVVAGIVLITVGLAVPVSRSPHIYLERETGSLPQADLVANILIRQLGPEDMVLSNRPAYLILAYYFQRAGIETQSLQAWGDGNNAKDIYLVVNEFYGETIEQVINTTDLAGVPGVETPILLHQFDYVAVYQTEIKP